MTNNKANSNKKTYSTPKKRFIATGALSGLMISGGVVSANAEENNNPLPEGREINIANPLQDYSAGDYADALEHLETTPNTRTSESETRTTDSGIEYTLTTETIVYRHYDPETGETTESTLINYTVSDSDTDHEEVQAVIDELRSERPETEENEDGSITTHAYKDSYDRNSYGTWADVDGNGIDRRNEVLWRDLNDVEWRDDGTYVDSGWYIDPFINERIDFVRGTGTSDAVHIDHVLPVGHTWPDYHLRDDEDKVEFYNYDMNLIALDGPENSSKGSLAPAAYLPPNEGIHCEYAMIWTHTSMVRDISLELDDIEALEGTLVDCFVEQLDEDRETIEQRLSGFSEDENSLDRAEIEEYITYSEDLEWEFSHTDIEDSDYTAGIDELIDESLEEYDAILAQHNGEDEEEDDAEDLTEVTPEAPAHNEEDNTVTIPEVEGVVYTVDGEAVEGTVEVPEDGLTVAAELVEGYEFAEDATTEWSYDYVVSEDENDDEGDSEEETQEPIVELDSENNEFNIGDEVTITGDGFESEESVEITLNSDPILLETVEADENGSIDAVVTIPEEAEAGERNIVATGLESGLEASVSVVILASEEDDEDTTVELNASDVVERNTELLSAMWDTDLSQISEEASTQEEAIQITEEVVLADVLEYYNYDYDTSSEDKIGAISEITGYIAILNLVGDFTEDAPFVFDEDYVFIDEDNLRAEAYVLPVAGNDITDEELRQIWDDVVADEQSEPFVWEYIDGEWLVVSTPSVLSGEEVDDEDDLEEIIEEEEPREDEEEDDSSDDDATIDNDGDIWEEESETTESQEEQVREDEITDVDEGGQTSGSSAPESSGDTPGGSNTQESGSASGNEYSDTDRPDREDPVEPVEEDTTPGGGDVETREDEDSTGEPVEILSGYAEDNPAAFWSLLALGGVGLAGIGFGVYRLMNRRKA